MISAHLCSSFLHPVGTNKPHTIEGCAGAISYLYIKKAKISLYKIILPFFFLCGCAASFLSLNGGRRLRVFENIFLQKAFRTKNEETRGR